MRILMVNSHQYLRGGSERCYFELADLLRSHGHEVIPFGMLDERNQPSPFTSYFVSNIDFPTELGKTGVQPKVRSVARVLYSREAKRNMAALIRAVRPDIAHLHNIAHELSPSILHALSAADIPVVKTLHDYKLICPNTSMVSQGRICEQCKGHRYYNVVRYRCKRDSLSASLLAGLEATLHHTLHIYARHVDTFIAPSRFLETKMREHGVDTPIVTIPNFVNPAEFMPTKSKANHIVYAGRLVATKGIRTLLRAMLELPDIPLYVAGTGELEEEMHAYARRHDLRQVTFLGHLERSDLLPLVQSALCTVLPSEWYENYPMSAVESLACGTPVVGSAIGGIPEIVRDGETGLLFEPGNAAELAAKLQALTTQPEYARHLGACGREQVLQINTPDRHYQATMEIYARLLSAR